MALPPKTDPRARSLRIEVAPSVAGTLFGALDYLTTYPYGCTEQTMSSFLPNVIVSRALKDVKTTSIRNAKDLEKKVNKGMNRLYAYQHEDGGWGWWKDDQSDPFMTAYVVSGLTWADQAGFDVPDDRIANGREKLKQMLDSGTTEAGTAIDLETRAFMVYAMEESGGGESHSSGKNLQRTREPSALRPRIARIDSETAQRRQTRARSRELKLNARPRPTTSTQLGVAPESDARLRRTNDTEATALSLRALSKIKPDSQLLPSVARWLVSNRRNSHYWSSTKDTAFAIFGLIDYLKVSKELSPDYDLEVYLNGENVLTQHVSSAAALKYFQLAQRQTLPPETILGS